MTLHYSTKALFTGSEWLNDVVLHIENDLVIEINKKANLLFLSAELAILNKVIHY